MTRIESWAVSFVYLVLCLGWIYTGWRVYAQEREDVRGFGREAVSRIYPPTHIWYMGDIQIYDTAGVCVYRFGESLAVVAKTALPPGTGCQ